MSNTLVLIAPGMLALPAPQLAARRSLATLDRYAEPPRAEPRGIAVALFTTLGVPVETPVGPLALLGAGADPDDDYVLCADPVHLAADRDTVVLARTIDDLSASDADTLVRMLDRHFAQDDLRFEALRPNAWFVRRRQPADIVTTPPDAARGRHLIANLPRGEDAGRWKRWQNEIEMLLHEHAVNAAREAQGRPAANAVWFWGGGRLADAGPMPKTVVTAAQSRLGDLAHGIARCTRRASPRMNDGLADVLRRAAKHGDASAFVLAVLPPADGDLCGTEAAWLTPALELLESRRIGELHVIADGNGAAATWSARPPPWWQRLAARASPRTFTVPPREDA